MAEGIRKPWLLNYLVSYAEEHGSQLSASHPKKGKFRTLPESPDEWIWADVSDKRHAIPVRFTMESVKAFNNARHNAGRRLTTRRWGIATIRCTRPLWCRPPAESGTGIVEKWTIALEVDHVEVLASEGEAMFGEPRCITKEDQMRRWIEGLRDPDGSGGNFLKLERIEHERKEREVHCSTEKGDSVINQHHLDPVVEPGPQHLFRGGVKETDRRQRLRNWKMKVKKIGLVQTQQHRKVPEEQIQKLNEITVFGMESPPGMVSPMSDKRTGGEAFGSPDTEARSAVSRKSTPSHMDLPEEHINNGQTTPTHWATSQQTNSDVDQPHEGKVLFPEAGPLVSRESNDRNDGLGSQPESSAQGNLVPSGSQNSRTMQVDDEDEMEVIKSLENVPSPMPSSLPTASPRDIRILRMVPPQHATPTDVSVGHERPIVLVPDSDLSGSQSQSQTQTQSLTQPSTSRRSLNGNVQHDEGQNGGKSSPLESDDEAGQRILTQSPLQQSPMKISHSRALGGYPSQKENDSTKDALTLTPVRTNDPQGRLLDQGSTDTRKTKRTLDDVTLLKKLGNDRESESAYKRRRMDNQDVVVHPVRHDADAWRSPSFMSSKEQTHIQKETGESSARYDPRRQFSAAEDQSRNRFESANPPSRQPSTKVPTTSEKGQKVSTANVDEYRQLGSKLRRSRSRTAIRRSPSFEAIHRAASLSHSSVGREAGDPSGSHISPAEASLDRKTSEVQPKGLKLGGWMPRMDIHHKRHIITWERLNNILFTVGQAREKEHDQTGQASK